MFIKHNLYKNKMSTNERLTDLGEWDVAWQKKKPISFAVSVTCQVLEQQNLTIDDFVVLIILMHSAILR